MSDNLFDIEKLVGSIATILAAQGSAREVAILPTASPGLEQSSYDSWDGGINGYTLTLSIPAHLYAQISDVCDALEESIKSRGRAFFKATLSGGY